MTNLLGTISLLSLCLPGFLFARLILSRNRDVENIALSFPLGVQLYTLIIFILNFFLKIQLTQTSGWIILVILSFFLWMVNPSKSLPELPKFKNMPVPNLTIFGIICGLFSLSFLAAHWFPITDWDAVTLYDFRAKIIIQTGWISDTLFRARLTDYPLLTSLAHWWMRINGSFTPLPIYPLFFWTFAAAAFAGLKRLVSNRFAFMATLFIIFSPKLIEQSFVAYSNLPYTIYLILGLVYVYLWSEKKNTSDLTMGIFLTCMSFWARTFPFAFGSLIAILLVSKSTRKSLILSVAIAFVVFFNKIPVLDIQLFIRTLNFLNWSILNYYFPYPFLFVLTVIYLFKNKIHNYYLLTAVTCFLLIIIAGNYYYALTDPNFTAIPDAAQRTMMFINPAIVLFAVTVLHKNSLH